MLTKTPKPAFKRYIISSIKTVLLFEAAGLAASYGLWYKCNTDRDFRLYLYKNYNWALEGYYGIGEKLSNQKTREVDLTYWRSEGKI